jgi:hypothetical protein
VIKKSRRSLAQGKQGKTGLEKERAMRRVADLIREVVAREKSGGRSSSVFSLKRLPNATPRRAEPAKRRRRKG